MYEFFSEYNSHFPTLIIFKIDDDGSALRVGAKYKSFTDLECALINKEFINCHLMK
jgi:hypothetical protein